jgi:hypothetical protein
MTESMGRALDPVPVPVADVKVEVIEGELLLYHPGQTRAVYLNPPAALIWSLCDGQRQGDHPPHRRKLSGFEGEPGRGSPGNAAPALRGRRSDHQMIKHAR